MDFDIFYIFTALTIDLILHVFNMLKIDFIKDN